LASVNHDRSAGPQLALGLHNWAVEDPLDWSFLFDRAVAADRAGFDQLVVSDHVVFGENLEAYASGALGGRDGGKQPTGPEGHWLEPMTVLSVIAGMTSQVRLSTGILLAALRRPVVLAKTAATLDVLSHGRLDLGVGIGWQKEEYDAAGLEFSQRGRLLDHTLDVCQRLWRDAPASYDGGDLHFERIHCVPRPVDPAGVPIWVSGTLNRAVLERVARFGSGWIPWGALTADPTPGIEPVRQALRDVGRDPSALKIRANLVAETTSDGRVDLGATLAPVPRLYDAGVTHFQLSLAVPRRRELAFEYLSDVVATFRRAAGYPAGEGRTVRVRSSTATS
jgi:probable F420-dependent oxidoreductase